MLPERFFQLLARYTGWVVRNSAKFVARKSLLDITLQGRGAKHFFTSGSGLLNSYPVLRQTTSVPGLPHSGLLAGGESDPNRWYFLSLVFKKWPQNVAKTCSIQGTSTFISQSLMLVSEDFFSVFVRDPPKSSFKLPIDSSDVTPPIYRSQKSIIIRTDTQI